MKRKENGIGMSQLTGQDKEILLSFTPCYFGSKEEKKKKSTRAKITTKQKTGRRQRGTKNSSFPPIMLRIAEYGSNNHIYDHGPISPCSGGTIWSII